MRKREWKEEYETRVWNLFGTHWIVTQETKGWVYPRDPDSNESGDETRHSIVQLFVARKNEKRVDWTKQIEQAHEIIDQVEGLAIGDGVLSLSLLSLCHDLWEDQGVLAVHAKEITDPAQKASFLPEYRGI